MTLNTIWKTEKSIRDNIYMTLELLSYIEEEDTTDKILNKLKEIEKDIYHLKNQLYVYRG